MHAKSDVGKPCPTCKFPIVLDESYDMESCVRCSDFCAQTSPEEQESFRQVKAGEWCVYPCPECGCPTEGEWAPEEPKTLMCSECSPKVRLRNRTALLQKARACLAAFPSNARERLLLVEQIDAELAES